MIMVSFAPVVLQSCCLSAGSPWQPHRELREETVVSLVPTPRQGDHSWSLWHTSTILHYTRTTDFSKAVQQFAWHRVDIVVLFMKSIKAFSFIQHMFLIKRFIEAHLSVLKHVDVFWTDRQVFNVSEGHIQLQIPQHIDNTCTAASTLIMCHNELIKRVGGFL